MRLGEETSQSRKTSKNDAVWRRGMPTQLARRALADAGEKTMVKEG